MLDAILDYFPAFFFSFLSFFSSQLALVLEILEIPVFIQVEI